jgi:hypothetical protein
MLYKYFMLQINIRNNCSLVSILPQSLTIIPFNKDLGYFKSQETLD